ncbi:Retrotransposon-derived protein PEG10 [Ceratobasidium sp. AG-Ba]|nr:Retrotransposon-derived protein PEG10 [Ceratobasidium sp. AG-Ba]
MSIPLTRARASTRYGAIISIWPEDCTKLGRLYSYLVGNAVNDSTPPAFHRALERLQNNLFDEIHAAETRIHSAVGAMDQGVPAQSPHRKTTPQRTSAPATEQETPKPTQGTVLNYEDFRVPTNIGSGGPQAHTGRSSQNLQEELRTITNIASVLQHALSGPREQAVRAASEIPGPTGAKSKIPAPEKYSRKKGNATKSFIMDCKTYFVANLSPAFPQMTAGSCVSSWTGRREFPSSGANTASTSYLLSDPAALQVAELQINDLKQTASGSDYATELRVIAGELEWSDSALMSAFCRGLEPYVRSKLIELTIGRTITSLDELINSASLIDNTLFEARKEAQAILQSPSSSSNKPADGKSA